MDANEAGALVREAVMAEESQKAARLADTPIGRMIRTLIDERRVWVDVARLRQLEELAKAAVTGSFVECGVAKGGSLAIMTACAGDRDVWGFDSFEPLPELTEDDNGSGRGFVGLKCSGPEGEAAVAATFARLGVSMSQVHIVKGWFTDTLPNAKNKMNPIAILRLDADWYEATRFALETLYDSVAPGGVVIIDDYGSFEGAKRAADEFRARRGIPGRLQFTPDTVTDEAFWFA